MHRIILTLAFLAFVSVPVSARACPKCNDCKTDHEKVCADECKVSAAKDAEACHAGCKKEKCGGDCSTCEKDAAASTDGDKNTAKDCAEGGAGCKEAKAG